MAGGTRACSSSPRTMHGSPGPTANSCGSSARSSTASGPKARWIMTDARWTPRLIEDRLEEAALTVRRLPPVKVQGHRSSWPPIVRDFHDAYGAEPATVRLGPPTAAAITRMDEAFVWLAWLEPDDARLLWARACGLPWKLLTYRFGASRTTLWRRWVAGLITIARSEEHTSELQSLMRISSAVFCLK